MSKGKSYTPAECQVIRSMFYEGKTDQEIAKILPGRTKDGIREFRSQNGWVQFQKRNLPDMMGRAMNQPVQSTLFISPAEEEQREGYDINIQVLDHNTGRWFVRRAQGVGKNTVTEVIRDVIEANDLIII